MNLDFQPSEYEGATLAYLLGTSEAQRKGFSERCFEVFVEKDADESTAFLMAVLLFVYAKP